MRKGRPAQEPQGTFAYENWRLHNRGLPVESALEYPLFSDAKVMGELTEGLGPYQIINCIAEPKVDPHRPILVLRTSYHGNWDYSDLNRTDAAQYHGGTSADEIAALISLGLGIRVKAGGATRWFSPEGDPKGRPWSFREHGRPDPVITHSAWGAILPNAQLERTLEPERRLLKFAELSPADSVTLVRAARLYQDAIWIAESEPALSWVLLVSAIETVASEWRRTQDPPRDRMRYSRPELDSLLEERGGAELAEEVAQMIADFMGSGRKFSDFCLTFLPRTPSNRPAREAERISWETNDLRKALRTIYNYRSLALHAGIPFPAPMCMPPGLYGDPTAECSIGGAGALGGTWAKKDLPMFLHVFEYIVRHAILSWWDSLYATE
jgi:hypothetical protein